MKRRPPEAPAAPLSPAQKERVPVDPTTARPLPPRAHPGYYPGYSTLSQQDHWDEATRKVVLERVYEVPPIRFFTAEELPLVTAVYERVMPQDDRDALHKIPVVNAIDKKLFTNQRDGYRFEDMPEHPAAMRMGLQAIEAIAQQMYQRAFVQLGPREQDEVLLSIKEQRPPAGTAIWQQMNIEHFWTLLVQLGAEAYYAHPYAWDEIGFGGPAYPRGYMRLENGLPEPWEVDEQRYEWSPPESALSGAYTPRPLDEEPSGHGRPGQSGSH